MPLSQNSTPDEIMAQYSDAPPAKKIDIVVMLGTLLSQEKAPNKKSEKQVMKIINTINDKNPLFFSTLTPELMAPVIIDAHEEIQNSLYKVYRYLQVVLGEMYKINDLKILLLHPGNLRHLSRELRPSIGVVVTPDSIKEHELTLFESHGEAAAGGDTVTAEGNARQISTSITQASKDKNMSNILKKISQSSFTGHENEDIEQFTYSFYQNKDKEEILTDLHLLGEAVHTTFRALLLDDSLRAIMGGMIKAAGKDYTPETHPSFQKRVRQAVNQGVRGKIERSLSMFRAESQNEKRQEKAEWYDKIVNKIIRKENFPSMRENP